MRRNAVISLLLIIPLLSWSCKAYAPIEKVTLPADINYTMSENISKQLAYLEPGAMISVTLINLSSFDLVFDKVASDTLRAALQKPKTSVLFNIPVNRIREVKVEKFDLPLTLIFSTIIIGGSSLIVSNLEFSGMTF